MGSLLITQPCEHMKARRVNEELLLIHLILISNYINRLLHILVCFFRLFEIFQVLFHPFPKSEQLQT